MATLKKIKYVTQAELDAIIAAGTQEENTDYRIKNAVTTAITSSSTNEQIPTAKAVYDLVMSLIGNNN